MIELLIIPAEIMSSNWLKSDWSLAHFLYYISRISAWLYIIMIVVQLTTMVTMLNDEGPYMALLQTPVSATVENFSETTSFETNSVKGYLTDHVEGTANLMLKKSSVEPTAYLLILFDYLDYGALIFGLFIFSGIMKSVTEKEPFRQKNIRRLYIIGVMVMLTPFYFALKRWMITSLIKDGYLQGIEFNWIPKDTNLILAGILIIVLGYVFKEGAKLYEEQKLTI